MVKQNSVTNEEILTVLKNLALEVGDVAQNVRDFMQMTSDRFDKVDERFEKIDEQFGRLEGQAGGVEGRLGNVEGELKELKNASYRHEVELGKQTRLIESVRQEISDVHIDINEILHRIHALEQKAKLDRAERAEAQLKLQSLIDWTKLAAKQIGVPLKLT
jgi:chromosome segregation ATPase